MTSKINFSQVTALIIDSDLYSIGILSQILRGFGMVDFRVVDTAAAARDILMRHKIDLVICEAALPDSQPGELIEWLRRQPSARTVPVILLTSYTTMSNVLTARDAGAHSVVRKPVSPRVMLNHIVWASNPERVFVETETFIGPDRRFKFTGPPDGIGRREGDLSAEIGKATEPNMTQEELDSAFRPTRMTIE